MTDQKLIRLIEDNGLNLHGDIEHFAHLVAAAEREQIIALNAPEIERINEYIKTLEEAVAAEREACAKMCEQAGIEGYGTLAAAAMIRARGEK